jgi:hypothetical protein
MAGESSFLTHHQRTRFQTAAWQAAEQRGFYEVGSRSLGVGSGVAVRRVATGAVRAERRSRDGAGEVTTMASIPLFMQVSRRSTVPLVQVERPVDGVSGGVPTVSGRGAFEGLRVWGTGTSE